MDKTKPFQRVVFQPGTHEGLRRGINQMTDAVIPTLGPLPRIVALNQVVTDKMPEMIDKGGVIARRIIALPDRDADMGAMLTREMLWGLQDQYGDGTATAAVLLRAIYNEGLKYIAAGGNAMNLKRSLEAGLKMVIEELDQMTRPVRGRDDLVRIAETICQDSELAAILGEVFDHIGEYGQLEIRRLRSRKIYREYVDGMFWQAKPFSRDLIKDVATKRVRLEDPAILITDLEIGKAEQLIAPMQVAQKAGIKSMLIVATKLETEALAAVMVNQDPDKFHAVAVQTPGSGRRGQENAIEDMAIITGGQPFRRIAGDTLKNVRVEQFGRARRAWASYDRYGIAAGKGDPRTIREHLKTLKGQYDQETDPQKLEELRERIGSLGGGAVLMRVGGATEHQIKERKELAEHTAGALRAAIREGVLPGGGAAFLACRSRFQEAFDQTTDPDEKAGYGILLKALESPARTIYKNAGYEPSQVMAKLSIAGPNSTFDVFSGEVVRLDESGIYDVAAVQKAAFFSAVSTATLALSVDVLVHHKKPREYLPVDSRAPRFRKEAS
jgi:chaperonin GroEL